MINQLKNKLNIGYVTTFMLVTIGLIVVNFHPSIWIDLNSLSLYNEKRLIEIFLLLIIALIVITPGKFQNNYLTLFESLPLVSRLALLLMFVLAILSIQQSIFLRYAWAEFGLTTLIFIAIFAVASARHNLQYFDEMVMILISVVIGIFVLRALERGLSGEVYYGLDIASKVVKSDFTNPRFFGQFQSWTLPLLALPVIFFWQRSNFVYSTLTFLVLASWYTLLIFSETAGSWLGVISASAVLLLIFKRKSLSWIKVQILAMLLGIFMYWAIVNTDKTMLSIDPEVFWSVTILSLTVLTFFAARLQNRILWKVSKETLSALSVLLLVAMFGLVYMSIEVIIDITQLVYNFFLKDVVGEGRWIMWRSSLELSMQNPWLGIGPHHFSHYMKAGHPHMSLLQLLVEYGWPFFLLLMSLIVWGFVSWCRGVLNRLDKHTKNRDIALTATLISAFSHSLVSGIIVMPLSQIMLVLIVGWMIDVHYSNNSKVFIKFYPVKSILLTLSIFIVSVVFIASIQPEVKLIAQGPYDGIIEFKYDSSALHPRFWHQGVLPWVLFPYEL